MQLCACRIPEKNASLYRKEFYFFYFYIYFSFLKNCTVDPSEEITKRVDQLGQIFSQKFAQAVGQRCEGLGKKVRKQNLRQTV